MYVNTSCHYKKNKGTLYNYVFANHHVVIVECHVRNGVEEEDTNGYHVLMLLPKATIRRCMYYIVADATSDALVSTR